MALKAHDLRELPLEEVERRVEEVRRAVFNLRVRMTTKEIEDTDKIRQERRDLARLVTVLTEKRREAVEARQGASE